MALDLTVGTTPCNIVTLIRTPKIAHIHFGRNRSKIILVRPAL